MLLSPTALFIDLNRTAVEIWPEGAFAVAYIVMSDLDKTQDFFKAHYKNLATIPHITCEITVPETLHILTRQPSVTRLSLPYDTIIDGLADHFALDAIINWDHRRTSDFYKATITKILEQGATHLSLYGLTDFSIWQDMQAFLNDCGLYFYDRFHAAQKDTQSPYQNHISHFDNVIALGGWSRITENNITRTKGPNTKDWTIHSADAKREDMLLLGLSARHGLPLHHFTAEQIKAATQSGLAIVQNEILQPTDRGLWDTPQLVSTLL